MIPEIAMLSLETSTEGYHDMATATNSAKLKIRALLNPSPPSPCLDQAHTPVPLRRQSEDRVISSASKSPATISTAGSTPSSSRKQTPIRQHQTTSPVTARTDAAVFAPGEPAYPINFPPFEGSNATEGLSSADRITLSEQHRRHQIYPSGQSGGDSISDFHRRIPHRSKNRWVTGLVNREAFQVFQYTFVLPSDPTGHRHLVMWDYQVGLVRMTPFFKMLGHTKTAPRKAIHSNAGLKDLSDNITGGALAAQGYWLPYSCARAMCTTFCYHIRFALTPMFGPSFINDCLHPFDVAYNKYRIDANIVRMAEKEYADILLTVGDTNQGSNIPCNQTRKKGPKIKIEASPPPLCQDLFSSRDSTVHQPYSPALSPRTTDFGIRSKKPELQRTSAQPRLDDFRSRPVVDKSKSIRDSTTTAQRSSPAQSSSSDESGDDGVDSKRSLRSLIPSEISPLSRAASSPSVDRLQRRASRSFDSSPCNPNDVFGSPTSDMSRLLEAALIQATNITYHTKRSVSDILPNDHSSSLSRKRIRSQKTLRRTNMRRSLEPSREERTDEEALLDSSEGKEQEEEDEARELLPQTVIRADHGFPPVDTEDLIAARALLKLGHIRSPEVVSKSRSRL